VSAIRLTENGRAPHARTIRVLVVDDHDLFRTGLGSLLASEPDLEVVGQASGGRGGVRLAAMLEPDVVLMDMRMPDLPGPEATRKILERNPGTQVVALTVASDGSEVSAALEAGASGFLAKDSPVELVVMAVRAAAQGATWLSPPAANVLMTLVRRDGTNGGSSAMDSLSEREREVLRRIAQGMGNAEIAEELSISPLTVKNHVSNILAKLGVPSRIQAAVYAVRRGLA
jgi:DNA-binding NarL/FixJ family response regulator